MFRNKASPLVGPCSPAMSLPVDLQFYPEKTGRPAANSTASKLPQFQLPLFLFEDPFLVTSKLGASAKVLMCVGGAVGGPAPRFWKGFRGGFRVVRDINIARVVRNGVN